MTTSNSKKIKLNNSGSTLVMAILTIGFVSLLASVILAAAVSNVIMKTIDNNSKGTFYTAESVVDEIKIGIGKDSMASMANSYEDVLAGLTLTSDEGVDYLMDNSKANELLKTYFIEDIVKKVTGLSFSGKTDEGDYEISSGQDPEALEAAKTYLMKYIYQETDRYAEVKGIESITLIKGTEANGLQHQMLLNNVVINYKAEKAEDTYFADITVDIEVVYPNMTVDFTSSEKLTDFREFALIADGQVQVDPSATENIEDDIKATVNSGIYAGQNIIITSTTTETGSLTVGANPETGKNSNIVTRGNVTLKGGQSTDGTNGKTANFAMDSSDLWCTNLQTVGNYSGEKDYSAGTVIKFTDTCSTYISDDLNIDGQKSNITIGGNYYGYSYEGTAEALSGAGKSSAIIISGVDSTLNLGSSDEGYSLKKLVVGGHSYISQSSYGYSDYMTGESLSFITDQEMYLLPAEYIGVGYEYSVANPMPEGTWNDINAAATATPEKVKVVDITNFTGKSYLKDGTDAYEVRTMNGLTYVYLNFKTKSARAAYIADVVAGNITEIKGDINSYTQDFLGSGAVNIVTNDNTQVLTSGILVETSENKVIQQSGTVGADIMTTSMDISSRFTVMSQLLSDLPDKLNGNVYMAETPEQALEDLKNYRVSEESNELDPSETDATTQVIDWGMVTSHDYNMEDGEAKILDSFETGNELLNLTKVAIEGSYTVPDDIDGGVIIATGDVTLDHDFYGLIITQGNIKLLGEATIWTNPDYVEKLITFEFNYENDVEVDEVIPFRNYFHAYKSLDNGSEQIKIEALKYDDIVGLNNWRKYDDSADAE